MILPLTALVDACVLCGPVKRNLVLTLAEAGLIRVYWSAEILSETTRTVVKIVERRGFADASERATRIVGLIDRAFPEATLSGFSHLESAIGPIPDDGDRHVIAAAMKANVDFIVTENLRDFPRKVLSRHALHARSSDAFCAEVVHSHPRLACIAVHRMRRRLASKSYSPDAFLTMLEQAKLTTTRRLLSDAGFCAEQPDD